MKKFFCIILCVALLLGFAGCGSLDDSAVVFDPNAPKSDTNNQTNDNNAANPVAADKPATSLYFEANGTKIYVYDLAEDVINRLGEPVSTFEAPSCAYQGMDVFYLYNGFQLTVNEIDEGDHVSVIMIVDDTVSIPQGLKIGNSKETMLELMGDDYHVSEGIYEYVSGYTTLQIQIKDDVVASILYVYMPPK